MKRVLLQRLAGIPILLVIVSVLVTVMTLFIPGDPAVTIAGENASLETIAAIRERLGYERPFAEQYIDWAGSALQGDLGTSLFSQRSVSGMLLDRVPVTASLTLGALLVAVVFGVPLGLLAGIRRGAATDRAASAVAALGVSMPGYWVGMLLILAFSVRFQWFPSFGYTHFGESPFQWARHLVLPSLALGASAAAEVARQLRSSMADVLQQDYVRTARAKGIRGRGVIAHHALKNAAGPAVTVLGLQVALLLGGAVVVEKIFGIPGLGQLAIVAVVDRDVPLIQGIVIFSTLAVVIANLVVDVAQGWLNPKVRAA